jgi:uncharacterized protein (TIGR03067 family)
MKQKLILVLSLGAALVTQAAETDAGFTTIFNGKDLTGWDGNPKLWSVKDGAIVGQTTAANPLKGNTFLIWTNGQVADFELRLSYKITPSNTKGFANSGIQYRSRIFDPANWVVGGYQADFEAGDTYSGILYEERMRGILAERGQKVVVKETEGKTAKEIVGTVGNSAEIQATIKKDDWNDYVVIAAGNHLQHFINGRPTVDVTDEAEAKAAKAGVLALQLHAGDPMTVAFKNLRIKMLSAPAQSKGSEIERMTGTWVIGLSEANGTAIPAEDSDGLTVKIAGGKYSVTKDGQIDRGTFSIDVTKSPKQMDIRPETGPGEGKLIPAIYEFNGDTLRVCYGTQDGADRPTSFKTAPDSGEVLITYKRKP